MNTTSLPNGANQIGFDDSAPAKTSLTSVVLASDPVVRHNSEPPVPSLPAKYSTPLTSVRLVGFDEPVPGLMSRSRNVPSAVPSLRHNSVPSAVAAVKYTCPPELVSEPIA